MDPKRWALGVLAAGGIAGCAAAHGDGHPASSTRASASASAPVPVRTPMDVEAAMASLRAARADAEKHSQRPSSSAFRDAGADLRAAGVEGHVTPLIAGGVPERIDEKTGIVAVTAEQQAILVFEFGEGTTPALHPRRLIGQSQSSGQIVRMGERFVLQRNDGTAALFTTVDATPIELPARSVHASKHGWFAFVSENTVRVLDAKTGREILPATPGVGDFDGGLLHDEEWIGVCDGARVETGAVVIDVASGKTLFQSHHDGEEVTMSCEIGYGTADLAIAYWDPKTSKVTLEGWNLETGKRWMTKEIAREYIPDLTMNIDGTTHVVTLESAPYRASREPKGRFDLHTGAALGNPPPPPPPPRAPTTTKATTRDPLAWIPTGAASAASVFDPAIEKLARPGRRLMQNYWSYSAGWTENGALSQDRKWLALLEEGAESHGAPTVLIVDAATLTVKQEVGLPSFSFQWASIEFLDETTIVARLEWHYWVIDAPTGALLASAEYDLGGLGNYERVRLLAPTEAVIGARVFDLRRDLAPNANRDVATPFASSQNVTLGEKDGLRTFSEADRYAFSVSKSGLVAFDRPGVPNWLVCVVKDEVFPFEACAAWQAPRPE